MKKLKPFPWIITAVLLVTLTACGGKSEQDPSNTGDAASSIQEQQQTEVQPPAAKLNLNTATEEQFGTLPGVGDRMVHEFLEYRPYISIRQFRQEIGKYVDEEQVAAYEEYVFVPIQRNDSDAATLQQIPGLDASEAEKVIAGRPYESDDAFLEALSDYITEEELQTAKAFLAAG